MDAKWLDPPEWTNVKTWLTYTRSRYEPLVTDTRAATLDGPTGAKVAKRMLELITSYYMPTYVSNEDHFGVYCSFVSIMGLLNRGACFSV